MSSSTEATPGFTPTVVPRAAQSPELRRGEWTRLGPSSLLGDRAAEQTLADVADQPHAAASAQGHSVGWAQGQRKAAEEARVEAEAAAARLAAEEARTESQHAPQLGKAHVSTPVT